MINNDEETIPKSNSLAAMIERKREKNKKKKLKKKASKARKKEEETNISESNSVTDSDYQSGHGSDFEIMNFELKGAFERFKLLSDESEENRNKAPVRHTEINLKARTAEILAEEAEKRAGKMKYPAGDDDDDEGPNKGDGVNEDGENNKDEKPLSKKKLKLLSRPTVSELKRTVNRPDVVEMWDVCAKDPQLLVYLKSYRNTVPVPRHWCAKRKYLQGKRGFEKPPFRLPDYIARTGIMEMRQTVQDKEADKNMKAKMREKIRPKVGRVDIDYHKLHDAFFKYQTKPYLCGHGDLYYEGKEFEVKLKEKKPGNLTEELRNALGLPTGNNAEKYPPPWLIAMQRYGPPPSYPNLKIPGLNAPIPTGCAFGYHPGGWGKPPVDESGRPIYGDVFGNGGNVAGAPPPPPPSSTVPTTPAMEAARGEDEALAHGRVPFWGEWESDEEDEEDDGDAMGVDSDDDEDMAVEDDKPGEEIAVVDASGIQTPSIGGIATPGGGYVTPSGAASIGLPIQPALPVDVASVELRKKTIAEQMEDSSGTITESGAPGQLYRVLPTKEGQVGAGDLMGSSTLYDVSAAQETAERGMEAVNPRDKMVRKRAANEQDGTTSTTSVAEKPAVTAKKYKEFKF